MRDMDCLQGATIVLDPVNLEGNWTGIECLDNLTLLTIEDKNLTDTSLAWTEAEFVSGIYRPGRFHKVTFTGKAVLYA